MLCAILPTAAAAQSWQPTFNTEVRYYSYRSSNSAPANSTASGGSGTQIYVPIAFQLAGSSTPEAKFEFLIRSAYVYARQSTAGATGTFSGTTDTTMSGSFTYLGWNGIQPFVSLSLNIPTGTSNAQGSQSNGKQDSDVVRTPAFGEGFNVGPTVGVNVPINANWMASFGAGYTSRGPFDREAALPGTVNRLDPGDVWTFNSSLAYRGGPLSLKGSIAYSTETTTTLDGAAFYKSGDRIILTGAAGYAWNANWSSRAQVSFSHFNKNKIAMAGIPDLVVEAFNSNSNVVNVGFDTTYAMDRYSIGPTVSYVYRDRNGWSPDTYQFLPAKTSWSLGVAGNYVVSQTVRVSANVARIWVREGSSPDKSIGGVPILGSAIPVVVTDAWQATISGTFRF